MMEIYLSITLGRSNFLKENDVCLNNRFQQYIKLVAVISKDEVDLLKPLRKKKKLCLILLLILSCWDSYSTVNSTMMLTKQTHACCNDRRAVMEAL